MHRATRSAIATPGASIIERTDKTVPALRTRLTLRSGENGTKKLHAKPYRLVEALGLDARIV